jgi:hypothetical protein
MGFILAFLFLFLHKEQTGLLTPELQYALLFIEHYISPFDVSYSKVKGHIEQLERQLKALAARNPLYSAIHLSSQQTTMAEHSKQLGDLYTLAKSLQKADEDLATKVDNNSKRADACACGQAMQLETQQLALKAQVTSQQVGQLATNKDITALLAARNAKRACSPTPSPPGSDAEEEARPEEEALLPSYEELKELLPKAEAANKVGLRADSSVPLDRHTSKRLPDLFKPTAYSGSPDIVVEDKLNSFERYLHASRIPVHL